MRQEGVPPQRILAVGGGTKNPLWLQIMSDVAGIEQYVPDQSYGASYGDAFMAGVGIGLFKDTTRAAEWVNHSQVIKPDLASQELYEPYYQIYRELYPDTAAAMHKLARLAS
jgi:xylulokinase